METKPEPTQAQLLHAYNRIEDQKRRRAIFFKTEEGKLYNRAKAKAYYNTHREEVLKRNVYNSDRYKAYYAANKETILEKARNKRQAARDTALIVPAEIPV